MGRGKHYHRWRRLGEQIEHRFYAGGWALRLPGRARIGMSDLPVRQFAPSEVHLCSLHFGSPA